MTQQQTPRQRRRSEAREQMAMIAALALFFVLIAIPVTAAYKLIGGVLRLAGFVRRGGKSTQSVSA